jgi:hypothetical protein
MSTKYDTSSVARRSKIYPNRDFGLKYMHHLATLFQTVEASFPAAAEFHVVNL